MIERKKPALAEPCGNTDAAVCVPRIVLAVLPVECQRASALNGGSVPTYQYACTTCDHRFEAVQKFTDNSLTACPECSGMLRKVYGSIGVVFKGSGFYRNDARGSGSDSGNAENGHSDAGKEPVKATGGNSDSGPKSADGTPSDSSASASSGSKESGSGSSSASSSNGSTSSSSSSGSTGGSSGGNLSSKPAAKAAKR
jgi:putative FmdB family regulatory protein